MDILKLPFLGASFTELQLAEALLLKLVTTWPTVNSRSPKYQCFHCATDKVTEIRTGVCISSKFPSSADLFFSHFDRCICQLYFIQIHNEKYERNTAGQLASISEYWPGYLARETEPESEWVFTLVFHFRVLDNFFLQIDRFQIWE